jgi:hypothetical protein
MIEKKATLTIAKNLGLFIITTIATLYIFWPLMWKDPVHDFIDVFQRYSHYGWRGPVLFNGITKNADHLPPIYIPEWICISTPILIVITGVIGCIWVILNFVSKPWKVLTDRVERNYLLYLFCLIAPMITIVVLRSSIYDDWRHLYFIYPSFVLIAMFVLNKLLQTKAKKIIAGICIEQVVMIVSFMVRNHPFSQVYFNEFVSHEDEYLRKNFELDYWG